MLALKNLKPNRNQPRQALQRVFGRVVPHGHGVSLAVPYRRCDWSKERISSTKASWDSSGRYFLATEATWKANAENSPAVKVSAHLSGSTHERKWAELAHELSFAILERREEMKGLARETAAW